MSPRSSPESILKLLGLFLQVKRPGQDHSGGVFAVVFVAWALA